MSYDPRLWSFVQDMNYDGNVTISDVWLWFKWFYFYPGDKVIKFFIDEEPSIANFFEISYNSYGGFISGVVSFIVYSWVALLIFGLFSRLIEKINIVKEDKLYDD